MNTAAQEWADYERRNAAARDAYADDNHCRRCQTPIATHGTRRPVLCPQCRKETTP